MSDYIKREDAISHLHKAVCKVSKPCAECWTKKYCAYYTSIADIPAADVVPVKRGHWIDKSELISLIEDYGDKCEAFGDYQGQANDEECNRARNTLYEEIDKIYAALNCGTNMQEGGGQE